MGQYHYLIQVFAMGDAGTGGAGIHDHFCCVLLLVFYIVGYDHNCCNDYSTL